MKHWIDYCVITEVKGVLNYDFVGDFEYNMLVSLAYTLQLYCQCSANEHLKFDLPPTRTDFPSAPYKMPWLDHNLSNMSVQLYELLINLKPVNT